MSLPGRIARLSCNSEKTVKSQRSAATMFILTPPIGRFFGHHRQPLPDLSALRNLVGNMADDRPIFINPLALHPARYIDPRIEISLQAELHPLENLGVVCRSGSCGSIKGFMLAKSQDRKSTRLNSST